MALRTLEAATFAPSHSWRSRPARWRSSTPASREDGQRLLGVIGSLIRLLRFRHAVVELVELPGHVGQPLVQVAQLPVRVSRSPRFLKEQASRECPRPRRPPGRGAAIRSGRRTGAGHRSSGGAVGSRPGQSRAISGAPAPKYLASGCDICANRLVIGQARVDMHAEPVEERALARHAATDDTGQVGAEPEARLSRLAADC